MACRRKKGKKADDLLLLPASDHTPFHLHHSHPSLQLSSSYLSSLPLFSPLNNPPTSHHPNLFSLTLETALVTSSLTIRYHSIHTEENVEVGVHCVLCSVSFRWHYKSIECINTSFCKGVGKMPNSIVKVQHWMYVFFIIIVIILAFNWMFFIRLGFL